MPKWEIKKKNYKNITDKIIMLYNGKAKVVDTFDELSIEIPTKKNWFILICVPIWLCFWFMGITDTIASFGVDAFSTIWLIGWTIGGFSAIYFLIWGLLGKEIILIDYEYLTIERSILGVGIKKRLEIAEIQNIRYEFVDTSLSFENRNSLSTIGMGTGPIRIDYGLKTYSFGLAVDEAEASYLIELIKKKTKK
ncbi:MAG: hypothetical protein PHR83_17945 [Paludibacter sp.]|nr:hypothetical protein [Paludibacter sp.]